MTAYSDETRFSMVRNLRCRVAIREHSGPYMEVTNGPDRTPEKERPVKMPHETSPYGHQGHRRLWAIEEVADRLGVQVRHVRRLVTERRIPFIKWGHLLRFDPDEVEEWLDAARRPPAA